MIKHAKIALICSLSILNNFLRGELGTRSFGFFNNINSNPTQLVS